MRTSNRSHPTVLTLAGFAISMVTSSNAQISFIKLEGLRVGGEEIRTWTNSKGNTIRAKVVSYGAGYFELEKEDGKLIQIKPHQLIKEDVELLKEWHSDRSKNCLDIKSFLSRGRQPVIKSGKKATIRAIDDNPILLDKNGGIRSTFRIEVTPSDAILCSLVFLRWPNGDTQTVTRFFYPESIKHEKRSETIRTLSPLPTNNLIMAEKEGTRQLLSPGVGRAFFFTLSSGAIKSGIGDAESNILAVKCIVSR